ncbi:MAG: flavin reductase family protein [Longimicrobiales bacterium]
MTPEAPGVRSIDPDAVDGRTRYQLLTSLVVPRPIGWISTFGPDGVPNLAPFSYFAALSASPMQVGVSIGHRREGPKDTLCNVRARPAFCVNVVGEPFLERMNATSADVPPDVDEFRLAGLDMARSEVVDAPFVADCPAVLECRVVQEVELGAAPNTLVIGRVVSVRLGPDLPFEDGTSAVDPRVLRPVGRLWGASYALPGPVRVIPRPE